MEVSKFVFPRVDKGDPWSDFSVLIDCCEHDSGDTDGINVVNSLVSEHFTHSAVPKYAITG